MWNGPMLVYGYAIAKLWYGYAIARLGYWYATRLLLGCTITRLCYC